jgi:hypothetical protein
MKTLSSQPIRIDTLIITVGTRQVGWHCSDGIVRCLGADGDRGAPPHIDELYQQELKIERGYHLAGNSNSQYGVRDLGERLYNHCQDKPEAVDNIELLLDRKIIADCVSQGLKHIILWGTNQPETVPWDFRRSDTLWLAELMALKIRASFPNTVKVDVLKPELVANKSEPIRLELETNILPFALQPLSLRELENQFVLAIENTGCAPAVAQGLEICVAALVRQVSVLNIRPEVPNPLYRDVAVDKRTAQTAQEYDVISVGDYFWPLERERVMSAWKRGDFREAEIWLTSHQSRYAGLLYQLAGKLALSTNWEIFNFLQDEERGIANWLRSKALGDLAEPEQINAWKEQVRTTLENNFYQAWESRFLIYLQLTRGNYTSAFMQFAQTLERLLAIYAKEDEWVERRLANTRGRDQEPSFYSLINAWCEVNQKGEDSQECQLLHSIRKQRNQVVHSAHPLTQTQVQAIWLSNGLFSETLTGDEATDVMQLMSNTLELVCNPDWDIPEQPLLRSLYNWGLNLLQSEAHQP